MNDDELAARLRAAEGPVTPDQVFADRLYLELAAELQLPSARGRVAVRRRRARPGSSLLAAAILLAALAVAVVIGGGQLILPPSIVTVPSGWAGFKGDAARRGEGSDGPTGSPVLRWRFQSNGAVSDNVSVAGDLAYASSDDGVLHALDVMTGEEHWSYVADQPPLRGPLVDGGVAYVFDGVGILHAVDAVSGAGRWRSTVPVLGPSSATVGDGAVYVGAGDGALVAIDAVTGAERWRVAISASGAAHAPAFADGEVYVAADGGGFVAVDASDGTIHRRFDSGALSQATTVVADGIAYTGGSTSETEGALWAIDAATGAERWRIDRPIFTPAVSEGIGYSGSDALGAYSIDLASGQVAWEFPVQGAARPVAVADGVVYVAADAEHRVYALDAASGRELWRFDVDSGIWCCIAVARGAAYVGTQLGGVYAIAGREDPIAPKD